MKIKSNKTFECYETAYENWHGGKDITLDGIKLIPITMLDKIRAEIEKERTFQRTMDEHDIATGLRKALEIIDKFKAESEEED